MIAPHPAPFNPALIRAIAQALQPLINPTAALATLDPFAGSGVVATLTKYLPNLLIYGTEIEDPWAAASGAAGLRIACGDALTLPFPSAFFDLVVTSPTFGNRMADHHNARDDSPRHTYRHTLGRPLHRNNSGQLQWGPAYREFHLNAWQETRRVLKHGAPFVLDIKDHYRKGTRQYVTAWHIQTLTDLCFQPIQQANVNSPGQRHGQHGNLRLDFHTIALFRYAP